MNMAIDAVNRWGDWLALASYSMLLQSTALILILATLDFLLRNRARAIVRYSLWMLLLVKLVLPVTLTLPTSLVQLTPVLEYSPEEIWEPAATVPLDAEWMLPETPALQPAADSIAPTAAMSANPVALPKPAQPSETAALSPFGIYFLGYLCVVSIFLLVVFVKSIRLMRFVRSCPPAAEPLQTILAACRNEMGVRRSVELRVTEENITPALCGIFRPTILLPRPLAASLEPRELKAVLLHELAHLKRGDLWVNLAQTLLQIAYFIHPLLWLANARIRKLREQAVDELVLVAMGTDADVYPATLVNVAKLTLGRASVSFGTVGILESQSAIAVRIRRILARPLPTSARLGYLGALGMVALCICVLPMGAKEQSPAEEPILTETEAGDFLKGLQFYPDTRFPEYRAVTNRIVQSAEVLLPLILEELDTPLPEGESNDEQRRSRARKIWALGIMGEKAKAAIPTLTQIVEGDESVPSGPHYLNHPLSFWAASALGSIGPDAQDAVPALIESAHFGNYNALPALARIAPQSAEVEKLIIQKFRDRSNGNNGNADFSRLAALEALSMIAPKSEEARTVLISAITDDDAPIRNAAVKIVHRSGFPGADTAIEKALQADLLTRVNTAAALVFAGDRREGLRENLLEGIQNEKSRLAAIQGLTHIANEIDGPGLMLPLLKEDHFPTREAVLTLLQRLPKSTNQEITEALLPLITSDNEFIRSHALSALGQHGVLNPDVELALQNALNDPVPFVCSSAISAVGSLDATNLAPLLIEKLEDNSKEVRNAALMAVGSFPSLSEKALPILIRQLEDTESAWAAAAALGHLGNHAIPAIPSLIQAATGTGDVHGSANNAIIALGKIGPAASAAIPVIEKRLKDPEPMIRLNAALALWRIDRQIQIIEVLKDRLASEENWDRLSMVNPVHTRTFLLNTVKELGPEAKLILPTVTPYLEHEDARLRQLAREAIAAIGGDSEAASSSRPKRGTPASPVKTKSLEELLSDYEVHGELRKRSQSVIHAQLIAHRDIVPFILQKLQKNRTRTSTGEEILGRQKAAHLAGNFPDHAREIVPLLLDCLEDDEDVRRSVTQSLGKLGPAANAAVPMLKEELHFENASAGMALTQIAPRSEDILNSLLEAVADTSKEPMFRSQTIYAIRTMQVRNAAYTNVLEKLSGEADEQIKSAALSSLGKPATSRFINMEAPNSKYSTNDLPALIERLRENADDFDALHGLRMLGSNSLPALPLLIETLKERKVRFPANLPPMIAEMGAAASNAVPVLIGCLSDDDNGLFNNTIISLGRIGPAAIAAKPKLISLLDDPDPRARWNAANSLRKIDPSESDRCLPILLQSLRNGTASLHEFRTLADFPEYREEVAIELRKLLAQEDKSNLLMAADTLLLVDPSAGPELVPALIQSLQNDSSLNVRPTIAILGKIGWPAREALPLLEELTSNKDASVAKAAREAIKQIEQTAP